MLNGNFPSFTATVPKQQKSWLRENGKISRSGPYPTSSSAHYLSLTVPCWKYKSCQGEFERQTESESFLDHCKYARNSCMVHSRTRPFQQYSTCSSCSTLVCNTIQTAPAWSDYSLLFLLLLHLNKSGWSC